MLVTSSRGCPSFSWRCASSYSCISAPFWVQLSRLRGRRWMVQSNSWSPGCANPIPGYQRSRQLRWQLCWSHAPGLNLRREETVEITFDIFHVVREKRLEAGTRHFHESLYDGWVVFDLSQTTSFIVAPKL